MNIRLLMRLAVQIAILMISMPMVSEAIRSVGNGGGFAEMQAYAIDKSLMGLVRNCVAIQGACNFLPDQQDILIKLLKFDEATPFSLIRINETCAPPFFHQERSGSVSIDACDLYQNKDSPLGPEPLPYDQIALRVLGSRLRQAIPSIDSRDIGRLSVALFGEFVFEDRQTIIPIDLDEFRMHDWSFRKRNRTQQFLVIEGRTISTDLTTHLENLLECSATALSWQFRDVHFGDRGNSRSVGSMDAQWSCGPRRFQAALYLDLIFENGDLKNFELFLFRKQELP